MCPPRAKPSQARLWGFRIYLTCLYLSSYRTPVHRVPDPIGSAETCTSALKAMGSMGKCFHSAEAAFLRREVPEAGGPTSRPEKLRATRLEASAFLTRKVRPRK